MTSNYNIGLITEGEHQGKYIVIKKGWFFSKVVSGIRNLRFEYFRTSLQSADQEMKAHLHCDTSKNRYARKWRKRRERTKGRPSLKTLQYKIVA